MADRTQSCDGAPERHVGRLLCCVLYPSVPASQFLLPRKGQSLLVQFVLIPKCILCENSILPPLRNPSWILVCDRHRKLPACSFNTVTQGAGKPKHLSLASSWTCPLSLPSAHLRTGISEVIGRIPRHRLLSHCLWEHYFQAATLSKRTLLRLYLHSLRFIDMECASQWFSVSWPFWSCLHNPISEHCHRLNIIPWILLLSVPTLTLSLGQH